MNDSKIRLDWIDAIKAFAIIGILLNHAVESYGLMPWFSNPSEYWPSFDERMANVFPKDGSFFIRVIQFLGWLGDMGPGVFIFASGLTLTLSALSKTLGITEFYKTRALRIYPLYIAIHLITIIITIFWFKWEIHNFWIPFSIAGLRFTNNLFWFINPSWWFIWLIIQLYFIFPYLFSLLKKNGITVFLITTLVITLLSRTAGILGYSFSADIDKWMTGIFAGTRLFEFSFGMYIGLLIHNNNKELKELLANRFKLPVLSILIYIAGFVASWTYFGSIFSIILITLGLSGIFYSCYEFVFKRNKKITNVLIWIGKNSFSTFLIHQTFFKFYGSMLSGYSKAIALTLIIILSLIAGHYIEKLVYKILPVVQSFYYRIISLLRLRTGLILSVTFIVNSFIFSFLILFGKIANSGMILLIFLFQFLYLVFYRVFVNKSSNSFNARFFDLAIIIFLTVLLFRGNWFSLFGLFILISYLFLSITRKLNHWPAVILVILFVSFSGVIFENYLRHFKPIEISSWGELPALQTDEETVYSLIPNKHTHLTYNNYDYSLNTNSLGFNSPEIDFELKSKDEFRILITGDAFSMPEGMNYEFSYAALLENKMKIQFPDKIIHVVNAGVTGYGPNEVYAQVKKYISLVKPDVIINEMFINEFQEINLTRNERLKEIGLIPNETVKSGFRQKLQKQGNIQLSMQIPFYVKNITGVNEKYNYNKSLLIFYERDSPFYHDSIITKMNQYLFNMNELSKSNNSKLIVLGVPGQIEVSNKKYISYFPKSVNENDVERFDFDKPLNIFKNLCQNNNILFLSTKNVLKDFPEQPLYYQESWHWNKKGHEVVASYLFDYLTSNIICNTMNCDK